MVRFAILTEGESSLQEQARNGSVMLLEYQKSWERFFPVVSRAEVWVASGGRGVVLLRVSK